MDTRTFVCIFSAPIGHTGISRLPSFSNERRGVRYQTVELQPGEEPLPRG